MASHDGPSLPLPTHPWQGPLEALQLLAAFVFAIALLVILLSLTGEIPERALSTAQPVCVASAILGVSISVVLRRIAV